MRGVERRQLGEVSAETCWVESCVSWVTSKTTEVANFGIWVAVSALTCVVDRAATCVSASAPIPVALIAAIWVPLRDWMSVVVSPWIAVTERAEICAAERLEIAIRPSLLVDAPNARPSNVKTPY